MLILIKIIFLLLLAVLWWRWYASPHRKIKQLKDSGIVRVDEVIKRYRNLPLGSLGVLHKIKDGQRVQVVFPKLTPDDDVDYTYSWHDLRAVRPVSEKTKDGDEAWLRTRGVAPLINERLHLEPEIDKLKKYYNKLSDLLELVDESGDHVEQQDTIAITRTQVGNLLQQAEALEQKYIGLIKDILREALIRSELVEFNSELLPEESFDLSSRYREVQAEYQSLKKVAMTFPDLPSTSHRGLSTRI